MASRELKLDCRDEAGEGQEAQGGNWDKLPPEVLIMIFNHLPVADLLSCSVVSKNWKKASRDVLKRSRECYAHIEKFPQDLQDLNDMIASKDFTQMFNGLSIKIRPGDDDICAAWQHEFSCSYAEKMLQSKQTRQKLEMAKRKLKAVLCGQWNYLNLDMGDHWGQDLLIEDALLLRELLLTTSESLQKLVIGQDQDCDFISCCGKQFTKLKVLQTQEGDTVMESCLERFVLEFTPNLEEITGDMLHLQYYFPGNPFMLKRMKSIFVAPDMRIPDVGLMEGFRHVSGLYRLNLQIYRSTNLDGVENLFAMVLRSLKTLEELYMYTSEFYNLLKTSDDVKFPNLRQLSLSTHWDIPIEDEISVLKRLKLPKLCPNLEHLELFLDECDEDYEEDDENQFLGPNEFDKSDQPIQINLKCRDGLYKHEYLKFLSQMYPKINKVRVLEWYPGYNSEMNSIFLDLHSIEYLWIDCSLCCPAYDPEVSIAAILCGINVEEAEFLFDGLQKKEDIESNRCIVPVRPTLFNAKNLKELEITGVGNNTEDGSLCHSWVVQVTENLPVRHVRELVVTIQGGGGLFRILNELLALTTLLGARFM